MALTDEKGPGEMNPPQLETRRLILRRFTGQDIDALYAILSDKEVNTFLPWFPVTSVEEAKRFYEERFAASYRKPQAYNYAVRRKEDNIPIGYVTVKADDSYDLGYGLRKEFWHQGIATEAARAVVEQGRRDAIPYLTATHDVRNPRSGEVMKRIGMRYQYSYQELVCPKKELVTFRLYQINLDGDSSRVFRTYWDHSDIHFVEPL